MTTNITGLPAGAYRAAIYRAQRLYSHPDQYDIRYTGYTVQFRVVSSSSDPLTVGSSFSACHSSWTPVWVPAVYPLHIGDAWEYTDELKAYVRRTGITRDTLMPNGRRYWEVGLSYQRQEGDTVYEWLPSESAEWLLYDFTLAPGDTVSSLVHGADTLDNVLTWTGPIEVDGIARRAWGFSQVLRNVFDGFQNIWVVDSIGQFTFLTYPEQMYFKGARINGRTFGVVSAVGEQGEVPVAYALEQNYPNPFNPATRIDYTIGQVKDWETGRGGDGGSDGPGGRGDLERGSVLVQLSVYDLLGRQVAVLVNERQGPGSYTVRFDGEGLASGVYFYRMQLGGFVETKKLLLLR